MANIVKPIKFKDIDDSFRFAEDLWKGFNKSVTVSENMDGAILSFQTDGTYPLYLSWPNRNRPTVAWIGFCREVSNVHTTVSSAPYVDWEMAADGRFKINTITGISPSPSNRFNIKIIALAN